MDRRDSRDSRREQRERDDRGARGRRPDRQALWACVLATAPVVAAASATLQRRRRHLRRGRLPAHDTDRAYPATTARLRGILKLGRLRRRHDAQLDPQGPGGRRRGAAQRRVRDADRERGQDAAAKERSAQDGRRRRRHARGAEALDGPRHRHLVRPRLLRHPDGVRRCFTDRRSGSPTRRFRAAPTSRSPTRGDSSAAVIDRGPYAKGDSDLTDATAQRLGFTTSTTSSLAVAKPAAPGAVLGGRGQHARRRLVLRQRPRRRR